ncbi:MAG: hypothetical protein KAI76_09205 [Alphaproteobacteria bacterium]|nr:hypothetical protein [Alphaproteobacteria bacterium]
MKLKIVILSVAKNLVRCTKKDSSSCVVLCRNDNELPPPPNQRAESGRPSYDSTDST